MTDYQKYLNKCRRQRPDVKAKLKEYHERYKAAHPDFAEKHRETDRRYYERNRSQRIRSVCYYNQRSCRDPIAGDVCKYNTLVHRKRNHPDWYENVSPKDCVIKVPTIRGLDEQLKEEYNL